MSSSEILTQLKQEGAVRLDRAALSVLADLEHALASLPEGHAGLRIAQNLKLAALLGQDGPIGSLLGSILQKTLFPVRAILFDKSATNNWALGWHQDRTVAVCAKHDVEGFAPWSTKSGIPHVEPPFSLIERLYTIRVHLDDVDEDNAPLLVALGSHLRGRVAEGQIDDAVQSSEVISCLAERGDVWLYATAILHASASSKSTGHRRVLQVDYADFDLPSPLQWRGI